MSESYAEFQNADGEVRIGGQIAYPTATPGDVLTVQDGGLIEAAAGGGSVPVTNQQFYGNPVECAYQDNVGLTWDSPTYDALFDPSGDSTSPVALVAASYAVSVWVQAQADMTVGTTYRVSLNVANGSGGRDAESAHDSAAATALQPRPSVTVSKTYYFPAGSAVQAFVTSQDVAAPTFAIVEGDIQRLS